MSGHVQHKPSNPLPWIARWAVPNGQRSKSFALKSQAEAFLAEQSVSKAKGLAVDPRLGKITFGEWSAIWMTGRLDIRESTRTRDEQYLRTMILPEIGEIPLGVLRRADLVALVATLHNVGKAPATTRKAFQMVKSILSAGVAEGLIAHVPADQIKLPKSIDSPMRVIDVADIERLADEIDPRYRALVLVTAYTGMRWGEVAGLEIGDIDFLRRTLTVRQALKEVSGRITVGPTKTRSSVRTITLPERIVKVLSDHIAESGYTSGFVFRSPNGGPLRRSTWRTRFWSPATRDVGLDGLTFHMMRHTNASLLIASGVDVQTVSSRLGHKSANITLGTYSHLMPGRDQAAADALDALAPEPERGRKGDRPADNVVSITG